MNVKNKPKTGLGLLIWGLADLYFILSVTFAMLLGVVLPNIATELHLSTANVGLLGFSFFLSFGFMQFFAGSLIDSKGPRVALGTSACIAAIGFFLLFQAKTLVLALIAQMIIGVGFSITYVGAIYLAERWFSKEQFPLMSGLTQMSANLISALVLFVMAVTGTISANFRIIAMILGIISLILALFLFLFVKSVPSKQPQKSPLLSSNLAQLLRIPQFWFGIIYFGSNFGVFLAFSSLWNIPDSITYGHSLETATKMSAMLRFGGAFGAVLSGWLVRQLGHCSTLVKVYSTGALILTICLIFGPVFPNIITFSIMALMGFFFGGTALGFPLVAQHIPLNLKGAGFGLMTSFGYLLSALLEYLVGVILNRSSLPLTVLEFKVALAPLVLFTLIGFLCSWKLSEKGKA
ncbi:MAG: MFS transporter [Chlamydiae bacterium]|nr:MFS transporter [Chlamydiota bacterium]